MEWRYLKDVYTSLKAKEAKISEPSKSLEKQAVAQAPFPRLQNVLQKHVTGPFSATGRKHGASTSADANAPGEHLHLTPGGTGKAGTLQGRGPEGEIMPFPSSSASLQGGMFSG